jgi:hypothetical protein
LDEADTESRVVETIARNPGQRRMLDFFPAQRDGLRRQAEAELLPVRPPAKALASIEKGTFGLLRKKHE